ncbi:MAG: DciA family protein [Pseudomonadota bacterium]
MVEKTGRAQVKAPEFELEKPVAPAEQRRMRGFEVASSLSRASTRSTLSSRGISEVKLIAQWREIVGDKLADACQPLRIKAPRGGFGVGGVLVLAVSGARASEIEHQGPRIIERVNQYYGYAAVANLQITQAARLSPRTAPAARPAPAPLSAQKQAEIAALTDPIENDALRGALARLGANIMRRPKSEKRRFPELKTVSPTGK